MKVVGLREPNRRDPTADWGAFASEIRRTLEAPDAVKLQASVQYYIDYPPKKQVQQADGLRIYGAGIVSSYAESIFALEDPSPNRIAFDLMRVMRSHYRIDDFQQNYFVVSSMEQLLKVTVETDFAPLYQRLESLPDILVGEIIAEDALITKGTQAYSKGYQVPKSPGG